MLPFRLRHTDKIVWIFLAIIGALVVLAMAFAIRSQQFFESRVEYMTLFEDGSGIKTGTAVKISGIDVGMVRKVSLNDDNMVEVWFDVLERFSDRIRLDSRVALSAPAGLGSFLPGGSGLVVTVGNRASPLVNPGGFVRAEEPETLSEILERWQSEGVVQNLKDIVEQVAILIGKVNEEDSPVWQSLENVQAVTAKVARGEGLLGELTEDESRLRGQVEESMLSLQNSLGQVEKATKSLQSASLTLDERLKEIDTLLKNLEQFSEDAKVFAASMKEMGNNAQPIPQDVRDTVDNLDKRIDDLGAIITGLKESFPINMVVKEDEKADDQK
jgi:phospholipid/cholesterol/gamma-HCH transport system substrate-binding protein